MKMKVAETIREDTCLQITNTRKMKTLSRWGREHKFQPEECEENNEIIVGQDKYPGERRTD
ncbi:hypothetical protein [Candidatus Liberibacter brunswickensis]|uniref:hypothetical protein n=1 Tax=Candidatus Liberibacter brunswickensis TaxID=1968796 RepID=UPI002FE10237